MAITDLHRNALTLLRQGDLNGAACAYARVLKTQPDDFLAVHRLGCIAMQMGQDEEASGLFQRAILLSPRSPAAHRNLGAVQARLGRSSEALASYDRAISLEPDCAETRATRAEVLCTLGRYDEAIAGFDRAIALQPAWAQLRSRRAAALHEAGHLQHALMAYDETLELDDSADTHRERGSVLLVLQRAAEALSSFDRAIELEPCDEQSHLARSAALRALGRSEEAVASCEKLLERNPQCAEAYVNRAAALQELRRAEDALVSCERAIALQPDCAAAHLNRGISLHALDRTAEALASWDRVLQLDPQSAPAYLSRGAALQALQRPEEALASCERAIALQPDCAAAHLNRSGALRDLNRFEEALASIERAITLDPEAASARFNAGVMQLQLGRFDPGWSLYENRLSALATSAWSHPFWRGRESIRDKSLFVHCEQGFGDTIQFCRYLTMAEAHGARVVLSVDDRLRRLLRSLSPTIRFLGPGERPESFDFHCPLLSLPRAFGTTIDTIPVMTRYLAAEADRVTHWRQRLGDEGFKIGICWQGNPRNPQDVGRSPPLEMFAPLATLPNVRLISLQREHGLEQLVTKPAGMTVEELGGEFEPGLPNSFLDAAAVMEGLDLVISGDTAIAHLAGALGRPTWVALRHVPEWRWLLYREDSPWYPTLRLFRQSRRGDWAGVFAAMRRALIHVRSDPAGSHAGSAV